MCKFRKIYRVRLGIIYILQPIVTKTLAMEPNRDF